MKFTLRMFAVSLLVLVGLPLGASTFTVINTNSSGSGSLADAIAQANLTAAVDTIDFNIPGSGVHAILSAATYSIDTPMTIDATIQPGYAGSPLIEIDGNGVAAAFTVNADATIRGFAITGFTTHGVNITSTAGSTTLSANYIGVKADGVTAAGGSVGVVIQDSVSAPGDLHLIGGPSGSDRNVISGNGAGIFVSTGSTANVSVQGNFIGTAADGASPLPNSTGFSSDSLGKVQVGGVAANIIAYNTGIAVAVSRGSTSVLSNSIFENGSGIVTGGNFGELAPRLSVSGVSAGMTQFFGVVTSLGSPFSPYRIQFFSNPTNQQQGRTFFGETDVVTDENGNAHIDVAFPFALPLGTFVTVTGTNMAQGETSPFSDVYVLNALAANLTLTKTTPASVVAVGQPIDYVLTVTDTGAGAASGVTVIDSLPPNTTLVYATPSQGSCSGTTTVSCSVGTLARTASATISLRLMPTAPGTVVNSASASANEPDPDGAVTSAPAVTVNAAAASTNVPTLSPFMLFGLAMLLGAVAVARSVD